MVNRAEKCPICGEPFDWVYPEHGKRLNMRSATLDRINNEEILTQLNTWIICEECNLSKGRRTLKEFIEYFKKVGSLQL